MVTTYASGAFLATIPSPSQGVWQLGPVPLRAYALCIIVGIIVAIWWGERRFVARGGPAGAVTDIAVFAVPFGLVGGRLYHVATDYQKYFGEGKNPLEALAIWKGGLGIWGAVALGAVGAWIACRRHGIPLPAMADAVAPGVVLAQAIGRLGNYFNQELYGGPTTLPWGLEIYERVDPATGLKDDLAGVAIDHTPIDIVHPTFLYELLWNVGVAILIVWADRKFRLGHGRVFALYVAGYTAGRFWIELMRTDPATLVFGQRVNVWVSVLVFIGAVVAFILTRNRGPREDLSMIPALDADKAVIAEKAATDPAKTEDGPDASTGNEPEAVTVPETGNEPEAAKAPGTVKVREAAKVPETGNEPEAAKVPGTVTVPEAVKVPDTKPDAGVKAEEKPVEGKPSAEKSE